MLCIIGEYDRSLGDGDRVLALEPRHFDALAGIDLIHIQKDKPREALTAFQKALAVNPFLEERLSLIFQSWSTSSASAIDMKATPEVPKTRRQLSLGIPGIMGLRCGCSCRTTALQQFRQLSEVLDTSLRPPSDARI